MFVSKKNLRAEIERLKRCNKELDSKVTELENENERCHKLVEKLRKTIKDLTLLYSEHPELEKAVSIECRTCKYAYKSDNYFNYGEAVGCMRKCVCSFYEREEEDEEEEEDNDNDN